MKGIVRLKLDKIGRRLGQAHGMTFAYGDEVVDRIAERCTQVDTGARNIDFIIDKNVLPSASKALIAHLAEGELPEHLELGIDEQGLFTYDFGPRPALLDVEEAGDGALSEVIAPDVAAPEAGAPDADRPEGDDAEPA